MLIIEVLAHIIQIINPYFYTSNLLCHDHVMNLLIAPNVLEDTGSHDIGFYSHMPTSVKN